MTSIGYTTSTDENDAAALRNAGATSVIIETGAAEPSRPALAKCLDSLASGDVLIMVTAADLARSISNVISTLAGMKDRGIRFQSLSEPALTASRAPVHAEEVLDALNSVRRRLAGSRTREGLRKAAADGRKPGRPTVMTPERVAIALELQRQERSTAHIARVIGVSPAAVRRVLSA